MSIGGRWQGRAAELCKGLSAQTQHMQPMSSETQSYTMQPMMVTLCKAVKLGLEELLVDSLLQGCGIQEETNCTGPVQTEFFKLKHVQDGAKLHSGVHACDRLHRAAQLGRGQVCL